MKKLLLLMAMPLLLVSCYEPGHTTQSLQGDEKLLPEELKGLKIYDVATSGGRSLKVGILKNQVVGSQYYNINGKYLEECLLIQKDKSPKVITVKRVISENDSIIVIQK
jgi:hypothetical protein